MEKSREIQDIQENIENLERNIYFMENELNQKSWSNGNGGGGSELREDEKEEVRTGLTIIKRELKKEKQKLLKLKEN